MKLFIWEGNGISDAYHDDGTLVVLAESAEHAREVVRAGKKVNVVPTGPYRSTEYTYSTYESGFDGRDEALDREPDRIVELHTPTVVAFNGGGYD